MSTFCSDDKQNNKMNITISFEGGDKKFYGELFIKINSYECRLDPFHSGTSVRVPLSLYYTIEWGWMTRSLRKNFKMMDACFPAEDFHDPQGIEIVPANQMKTAIRLYFEEGRMRMKM